MLSQGSPCLEMPEQLGLPGSRSAQEFFRWTGQCRSGWAARQALEIGSDGGPESYPEEVAVSLFHRESSERLSGQRGSNG